MTSKPKSWRDLLPVHPAAELFPMMSEEELRALGEDIKKNGLREGVALLDGKLLDGRNRLEAMEAVGIKLTTGNGQIKWAKISSRNVKGADPIAFVISKNIQRRHLSADQKRDVIAKLIKATPEKSDRQIAEQTKASSTTVGKVRKDREQAGDVSKLDTRTDTKGRKQQARKPPSTTKPPKSPAVIAAADRAEARADRTARRVPDDEPTAAPPADNPDGRIARLIDDLRTHVRLTAECIGRECPENLGPLRDEIDAIFRKIIEARAPKMPASLGSTAPCVSEDDLALLRGAGIMIRCVSFRAYQKKHIERFCRS
jgi:hypothetical protein